MMFTELPLFPDPYNQARYRYNLAIHFILYLCKVQTFELDKKLIE